MDTRPASLLAEVVYFTRGLAGVGEIARKWGGTQPHGYLFWLDRLRQEKRRDDIMDISKEALAVLKTGPAWEKVSDFLARSFQAGSQTNYQRINTAPAIRHIDLRPLWRMRRIGLHSDEFISHAKSMTSRVQHSRTSWSPHPLAWSAANLITDLLGWL